MRKASDQCQLCIGFLPSKRSDRRERRGIHNYTLSDDNECPERSSFFLTKVREKSVLGFAHRFLKRTERFAQKKAQNGWENYEKAQSQNKRIR